jgi:hypothetical protein
MTNPNSLEPVRALRSLARRAAQGESVAAADVTQVLDALGPMSLDFVYGRALHSLVRAGEIEEPASRRRLFHAARALAERLDEERIHSYPIEMSRVG